MLIVKEIRAVGEGNNLGGINVLVRHVIVILNVGHVDGVADAWEIGHHTEPAQGMGAVLDLEQIALEVSHIHRVPAEDRGKEADIGLGKLILHNECLLGED